LFCIGAFLIGNILSQEDPDLTLIILIPNDKIEKIAPEFCEYFKQFTPDLNGDGEVIVSYMYIPVDENMPDYYIYLANSQNLSVQLESSENLIYITDSSSERNFSSNSVFYNLSLDYKNNSLISSHQLLIGESNLRSKLGYEYRFTHDSYIAIRRSSDPSFQQQYNILKKVIASLKPYNNY
jgi:hypothetical protein